MKAPDRISRPFLRRGTGRQQQRHAEAEIAVAEVRRIAVAHRAATVRHDVAPPAAAYRETIALVEIAWVRRLAARIRPMTTRAELPDVAQHVVKSKAIGAV